PPDVPVVIGATTPVTAPVAVCSVSPTPLTRPPTTPPVTEETAVVTAETVPVTPDTVVDNVLPRPLSSPPSRPPLSLPDGALFAGAAPCGFCAADAVPALMAELSS